MRQYPSFGFLFIFLILSANAFCSTLPDHLQQSLEVGMPMQFVLLLLGLTLLITALAWRLAKKSSPWKRASEEARRLEEEGRFQEAIAQAHKAVSLAGDDVIKKADSLDRLAYLNGTLGFLAQAESYYKRALSIRREHAGSDPQAVYISTMNLAEFYLFARKPLAARRLFRRSLKLAADVTTQDVMLKARPHYGLGQVSMSLGKYHEAGKHLTQALTILEDVQATTHPGYLMIMDSLGHLRRLQNELRSAESIFTSTLKIRQSSLPEGHQDILFASLALIDFYLDQDRYEEAGERLQELGTWVNTHGLEDTAQATFLECLARQRLQSGARIEAEEALNSALVIRQTHQESQPVPLIETMSMIADVHLHTGEVEQAETVLNSALDIANAELDEHHPDLGILANKLGHLKLEQKQFLPAQSFFHQASQIAEKAFGKEHYNFALSLQNLGELYHAQGTIDLAEAFYLEALAILEKNVGQDHQDLIPMLNQLGHIYLSREALSEAEAYLTRIPQILAKFHRKNALEYGQALSNLAGIYRLQGDYHQAENTYKEALTILESAPGADQLEVARVLCNRAEIHDYQDDLELAEPLYCHAMQLYEKALSPYHPDTQELMSYLVSVYERMGLPSKAQFYRQKLEHIAIQKFKAKTPYFINMH